MSEMAAVAAPSAGTVDFPRDKPIFVFDGICVLCSGGASRLMRYDLAGKLRYASAQSPVGQALYAEFGLKMDSTYLLVDGDRAYTKSDGYLHLLRLLGGWWRIGLVTAIVPGVVRDWVYDRIANNRYRWFGKANQCELLTPQQRERLL